MTIENTKAFKIYNKNSNNVPDKHTSLSGPKQGFLLCNLKI